MNYDESCANRIITACPCSLASSTKCQMPSMSAEITIGVRKSSRNPLDMYSIDIAREGMAMIRSDVTEETLMT
jgi:hypothetical protein